MSDASLRASTRGGPAAGWVTAGLTLSAALTIAYGSAKALGRADTERMESPLMLSVARQLVVGPGELYGPFGGANPLVLIHAPLYYRCAALGAWPLARAGLHPVEAARLAGRLISLVGLVATMAAAYRLGRVGGRSSRSGWWSALLVAAAPVLAGQPFAVRPDMAGVALQSWGVVLVLESLGLGGRRLALASVLFGLSACVKQHYLGAWAVSTAIVTLGWVRGRVGAGALPRLVLPGLAALVGVYGTEWWVTAGRVWEAAFVAAAHVGRVHPGDWDQVLVVMLGIFKASAGIVAALAAPALAMLGSRPGPGRRLLAVAGTAAVGLVLAASLLQAVAEPPWTGVVIVFAAVAAAVLAVPAAALSARPSAGGVGTDAALWAYLLAGLGLAVALSRMSSGAWLNYGIPATVFAAALAGRALSRGVDAGLALPLILATLAVLASSLHGLAENERRLAIERSRVEPIDEHLRRPRSCYFFTDRPGLNRLDGRIELVYDAWLYPVFETLGLAESRSRWLGHALGRGPIRVIVSTDPRPIIAGTALDLRRLGFHPDVRQDPYFVWIR